MGVRGRNLIFNGCFELEDPYEQFPLGWVKVNGDAGTEWAWTTEYPVLGRHTVKVTNRTYTGSFAGIAMDQRYAVPVRNGEVFEASAWMRGATSGVPLRIVVVFMDDKMSYMTEYHLKFNSDTTMQRCAGPVLIPAGASYAKLACGAHDTPDTLPSDTWISWVSFRRAE